ncbi:Retrovirus-related Pol polyprotein from transposon TNT 1-94 [Gossypium australe]|uniref:Retrovirus-related Pol polyprotein from transposon TNT 1-94 n=1 Tax=Gossypium australe TaxID=47621 RepID=A0A5B6W5K8_9ROSI|nr:Retrovirus-related Pol polyprotein from transposon TNT 1-94 [Gossypium australe]
MAPRIWFSLFQIAPLLGNLDSSVVRNKARLIAQGFSQATGMDYHETFSPVIKANTVHTMLSLAVSNKWKLRHVDVNNAFLNESLADKVYMRQPLGFEVADAHGNLLACKLNKALTCNFSLPKLIIHFSSRSTLLLLVTLILRLNQLLNLSIESLVSFLDLMWNAKFVATPMVSSTMLSSLVGSHFQDGTKYRQIVEGLQYICLTRPNITFAVNKVSQYLHLPYDVHWTAVKRILRYVRGRKSTFGFCIYLGDNLIGWSSKKQGVVSRSTSEAEYKSLANATAEII